MRKKFIVLSFAIGVITQATCGIVPESDISNAAIIQPKLCYSDIWVTDYEVIGTGRLESISGKYPYLEHRLDVYTDGTAKYYEYNNHEWDSYSYDPDCTVIFDGYGTDWSLSYDVANTFITDVSGRNGQIVPQELLDFYVRRYSEYDGTEYFQLSKSLSTFGKEYYDVFDTVSDEELSDMFSWTIPNGSRSMKYTFCQPKCYSLVRLGTVYNTYNTIDEFYSEYKNIGGYSYPYSKSHNSDIKFDSINESYTLRRDCTVLETFSADEVHEESGGIELLSVRRYRYKGVWVGKLANLPYLNTANYDFTNSIPGSYYCVQYREITPTTDFTNGMSFTFGNHQTEVPASAFTSEEPIINQESLEDRVIALEKENQELRESSSANNVKLDNHTTGYITASDAQDVLRYYCESIVGNESGSVDDYNDFIKRNAE